MADGFGKLDRMRKYQDAYRRYCWPVQSLADYRLAPFHLLASEGAVHLDKTNRWHMETLHRLAAADPTFFVATPFREVELADDAGVADAARWWEELTGAGGEGMVVKPLDFVATGPKRMLRETGVGDTGGGSTCGSSMVRIMTRRRISCRGCGSVGCRESESMAARGFALGMEALEAVCAEGAVAAGT